MSLLPDEIKSSNKYSYSFTLDSVGFYFDYGHGNDYSFSSYSDKYTLYDKNSIDSDYIIALNKLKTKFKVNVNSDFLAYSSLVNTSMGYERVFAFHYSCLADNIVKTGSYLIPSEYDSYLLSFAGIFKSSPSSEYTIFSTPHIYPYYDGSQIVGKYPKPLYSCSIDNVTKLTNRFLFQYVYDSSYSYVTGEDGFEYLQTSKIVKYFAVSLVPTVSKCCLAECFGITN